MKVEYKKHYSNHLQRDIEFRVYGHGGKPVLMFPTSNARFYQYEDFGLINALSDLIEKGKIQVFTADSIDPETLYSNGDAKERIAKYERYLSYVVEELVPEIYAMSGKKQGIMVSGCSMGGYHAAMLFFRYPESFDSIISMSGVYTVRDFFGGYDGEDLRAICPAEFIADITVEDARHKHITEGNAVLVCGSGAYEDRMLVDMELIRKPIEKNKLPVMIDIWGKDVYHDWPWWHKQMPHFLNKMFKGG